MNKQKETCSVLDKQTAAHWDPFQHKRFIVLQHKVCWWPWSWALYEWCKNAIYCLGAWLNTAWRCSCQWFKAVPDSPRRKRAHMSAYWLPHLFHVTVLLALLFCSFRSDPLFDLAVCLHRRHALKVEDFRGALHQTKGIWNSRSEELFLRELMNSRGE